MKLSTFKIHTYGYTYIYIYHNYLKKYGLYVCMVSNT